MAADTLGCFLHGLREGRVGVNVAADFLSGEVEALRQGQLRQQLGYVGAHHVAADELAVLAVRDELDKTRGLIEASGLAVSGEREGSNLNVAVRELLLGSLFGVAEGSDLRVAEVARGIFM